MYEDTLCDFGCFLCCLLPIDMIEIFFVMWHIVTLLLAVCFESKIFFNFKFRHFKLESYLEYSRPFSLAKTYVPRWR